MVTGDSFRRNGAEKGGGCCGEESMRTMLGERDTGLSEKFFAVVPRGRGQSQTGVHATE